MRPFSSRVLPTLLLSPHAPSAGLPHKRSAADRSGCPNQLSCPGCGEMEQLDRNAREPGPTLEGSRRPTLANDEGRSGKPVGSAGDGDR